MEITYQVFKEEAKRYIKKEYPNFSCQKSYNQLARTQIHIHMHKWLVNQWGYYEPADAKKIINLCSSYEKRFYEDCQTENFL